MKRCPTCSAVYRTGDQCPPCGAVLFSAQDPRIGARVDRFVIETLVHEGPLACVYLARDDLGKRAAVKIFSPGPHANDRERIDRERVAQRSVEHPNVARIVGWGALSDGTVFLASEWVDGPTLEARLGTQPISSHDALMLVRALCDGLRAIHAAEIVHRDLKPANIALPTSGQPRAKILDFGCARVLRADRLTDTGVALGSSAYMAPEQAAGRTVDARADLYALGVVFYRMLTGVLPFVGSSADVLRAHQQEPIMPPHRRAPHRDIPQAAEDLCLWLLAKDPARRPPSARIVSITVLAIESEFTKPSAAAGQGVQT